MKQTISTKKIWLAFFLGFFRYTKNARKVLTAVDSSARKEKNGTVVPINDEPFW